MPTMQEDILLKRHVDSRCQLYLYNPPDKAKQRPCDVDGCKDGDPVIGLVICDACLGLFCLKHRYRSAHSCASESLAQQEKQDRKVAAQQKIEQHLGKRIPTAEKSNQATTKVKKPNLKLELMKMKGKAKGDTSIPLESRMYFTVHFPENSGRKPSPLFFDKSHTIGRMLDQIAKIGNIPNNNHLLSRDDPKRLQIALLPDKTVVGTEHRIEGILDNTSPIIIDMNMNLT
ncbi:hypothetical protein INT43_004181 [Umbelopsis isabellina]|uniref:AN1-type domain-containing protein n=1 Tax=Mortierella isabellina TaxID=91625 RepID=A0A8H7PHS1_MORIS|nr:hypothetical protein INT43_004181 [Umbelopsis isabellina]